MTDTQRAVRYEETGAPEVLRVVEIPVPEPGEGEVVVGVRATGINPFDSKVRRGVIPWPAPFPRGLGSDFAGVVTATGAGAAYADGQPVSVGDAVLGWGGPTLQQQIAVPAAHLARKPAVVPFAVAGALSTPGQTAVASLGVLEPGPGDVILVSAAAGAVGFLYSQLAIMAGAKVIGTASAANHERLRAIGVTPVEYGPGLADRVRAVAPEDITGVQDDVGGEETIAAAFELGVPPERICEIVDHAATERLGLVSPGRYERRADVLQHVVDLVAAGGLRLDVQQEFALDDAPAAFALMETRHLSGKVVVTP